MARGEKREKKYWNDYLKDTRLEDDGKYSYTGAHYDLQGTKGDAIKGLILAAATFLAAVSGGILPATGAMDTWYVIIPYATTIALSGFNLYYGIKWIHWGGVHLRTYVYEKTIPRIPKVSKAISIAAFITLAGEIFHLITHGMGEHPKGAVVLMISVAVTGVLGIALFRHLKGLEWLNSKHCEE